MSPDSSDPFVMPFPALTIMAGSLLALAAVWVAQYVFGIRPCELCQWQRLPYVLTTILGFLAVPRPYRHTRLLFTLAAMVFCAGSALALFHTGVERHWWVFHSSCTGGALDHTKSLEDMRQQLLGTPVTRCDQISWSLFGLSLANFNLIYSVLLMLFGAVAARRARLTEIEE